MLRPFASFGEGLLICSCKRLVVDGGVRNRTGDGVEQTFKHTNRGGHLVGSKVLDQFVGMLFVCSHKRLPLYFTRYGKKASARGYANAGVHLYTNRLYP